MLCEGTAVAWQRKAKSFYEYFFFLPTQVFQVEFLKLKVSKKGEIAFVMTRRTFNCLFLWEAFLDDNQLREEDLMNI